MSLKHGYYSGFGIGYDRIEYFKSSPFKNNRPLFWAESIDEEMYFQRGSITTALNVLTACFNPSRIVLLGVDLSSAAPFYEGDARLARYVDRTYSKSKLASGMHATACPHPTVPPIQDVLVDVFSLLNDRGVTVVSGNESSLLVQNGLCQAISF